MIMSHLHIWILNKCCSKKPYWMTCLFSVQSVSFPHGIFSYQNVSICLGCLWCATEHFFIFSLNDFTVLFKMTRSFHLAYKILSFSLSAASFIFCTKSQVNFIKYALNKIYPLPISNLEDFNAKKTEDKKTQRNVNGPDILMALLLDVFGVLSLDWVSKGLGIHFSVFFLSTFQ